MSNIPEYARCDAEEFGRAENRHKHIVRLSSAERIAEVDKADALRGSSHDDGTREESRSLGEEGDSLTDVEDLVAERRRWLQVRNRGVRRSG